MNSSQTKNQPTLFDGKPEKCGFPQCDEWAVVGWGPSNRKLCQKHFENALKILRYVGAQMGGNRGD